MLKLEFLFLKPDNHGSNDRFPTVCKNFMSVLIFKSDIRPNRDQKQENSTNERHDEKLAIGKVVEKLSNNCEQPKRDQIAFLEVEKKVKRLRVAK